MVCLCRAYKFFRLAFRAGASGAQPRVSTQQITESKGANIPARRYDPYRFALAVEWVSIGGGGTVKAVIS
jgi:hypothetical protein